MLSLSLGINIGGGRCFDSGNLFGRFGRQTIGK
jgi:hypothetical protein